MSKQKTLNTRAVICAVSALGTNHKGEVHQLISWGNLYVKAKTCGFKGDLNDLRCAAETPCVNFCPDSQVSQVTGFGSAWLKLHPAPIKPVILSPKESLMAIVAEARIKFEELIQKLSEMSKTIKKMARERRITAVKKMIDELFALGRIKVDKTPEGLYVQGLAVA